MLKSLICGFLATAVLLLGADTKDDKSGFKPTPLIRTVTPDTAKVGDVIAVQGENLGKANVKEFYLTDGKLDLKTPVVEQTDTDAKVKVPAAAKAGRYRLMILTGGVQPQLLEQPVAVEIQ